MNKLRLPIGTENFENLRNENLYYVDKTGLIKELLDNYSMVTLLTRPRRFGKSLNMSMLRYFFEIDTDKSLFDGLFISTEKDLCKQHMGKYPVISISLKDVEGLNFESACRGIWRIIQYEANRLYFLTESDKLTESEKNIVRRYADGEGDLEGSLRILSQLLYKHFGSRVVILIDEYDVPLDKAYQRGYYDEMIQLIRQMFNAALKTNDALQLAVLTGCLRISKESIFTGLNNMKINTIVDDKYNEWFGFTDSEVKEMLAYYGLVDYYEKTKEWYDGYKFGDVNIYCPWDVINWCDLLRNESRKVPQNFWANTSSNDMIIKFAEKSDADTKSEIERLIAGETVYKRLHLDLTYPEIDDEPTYLWSVLFTTGYLTWNDVNENGEYGLLIPNLEIKSIFEEKIDKWFSKKVLDDMDGLNDFVCALKDGRDDEVQKYLNDTLSASISFYDGGRIDVKENFYHGILLGMLKSCKTWNVLSNREAGDGRADIIIEPMLRRKESYAIIIEVKYTLNENMLEQKAKEAIKQIEDMRYDDYFRPDMPREIKHYGIAFCRKRCCVVLGED